jgi:hypothetical protein
VFLIVCSKQLLLVFRLAAASRSKASAGSLHFYKQKKRAQSEIQYGTNPFQTPASLIGGGDAGRDAGGCHHFQASLCFLEILLLESSLSDLKLRVCSAKRV